MPPTKHYDRAYFDRWYRDESFADAFTADVRRQVGFAVAVTERMLGRPIESVIDAGAGEGRWYPLLRELRPDIRYIGFDSSEWAVKRWGKRRNLHLAAIETLGSLDLDGPFDLVVAADVFHYLKAPVLKQALAGLVPLIGGVAFFPTFTVEDEIEGDKIGFQPRRAATYRRYFRDAGLHSIGMNAWTNEPGFQGLARLERTS